MGNCRNQISATLELESVKRTNSMLSIFEVSLSSFKHIAGTPEINLICENHNSSFDHILCPFQQTPCFPAGLAFRSLDSNVCIDEKASSRHRLDILTHIPTPSICPSIWCKARSVIVYTVDICFQAHYNPFTQSKDEVDCCQPVSL